MTLAVESPGRPVRDPQDVSSFLWGRDSETGSLGRKYPHGPDKLPMLEGAGGQPWQPFSESY